MKRLSSANQVLTQSGISRMKQIGNTFLGRNYDLTFEWSDQKIYCSELIWKVYKRALGIEVGKLQKLRDFDLADPLVVKKMKERYGDKLPLDETVISPVSIFDSPLLETVSSN